MAEWGSKNSEHCSLLREDLKIFKIQQMVSYQIFLHSTLLVIINLTLEHWNEVEWVMGIKNLGTSLPIAN